MISGDNSFFFGEHHGFGCPTFLFAASQISSLSLSRTVIAEAVKVMFLCKFAQKFPFTKDVFSKKKVFHTESNCNFAIFVPKTKSFQNKGKSLYIESTSFLRLYFVAEIVLSESFCRTFRHLSHNIDCRGLYALQ